MLRLCTLGRLELEGVPAPTARALMQGPKRVGLLVYLACAPPGALIRRDTLLALFWPELDESRARHALRNTLHSLRSTLGAELISSAGAETVGIPDGMLACDVAEFERALAEDRLEDAVALYPGDFLTGFFVPESQGFEDWVEGERQRLRRAYHLALERIAEAAGTRQDWTRAIEWWHRLADAEPQNGRFMLRLMESMVAAGDRAGALYQAQRHAEVMRQEFDADPDAEVAALAERLKSEPAIATKRSSGPAWNAEAPARPNRLRSGLALAGALALIALAGVLALVRKGDSDEPVLDPQRVVIAPFENHTGDAALDPAGTMAADWIIQGLLRTALVDVTTASATLVSSQRVQAQLRSESGLDPVHALAEETGAGLVVSGSYYRQGDSLLFQARITDARRRAVVRTLEPISAPAARPLMGIELLRRRLLAALAPLLDPRLVAEGRVSSQPPSYEAYRAYAEGMEAMIASKWRESITHFEEAVALDSSYLLPSLLIAVAHENLREHAQADSIARVLDRSRDRLGAYDRALLDMVKAWLGGSPIARYTTARRAAAIAPGSLPNVQWGIEALRLNHPHEAITILSAIDPTRGEVRGWIAYWHALTLSYHMLEEHETELATAKRAALVVPERPFWLREAAGALGAMGRIDELNVVVNQALATASPDTGAVRALNIVAFGADELREHGHAAAAQHLADRAAAWYANRSEEQQARARPAMLRIYYGAGRQREAQALVDQLVKETPEDLTYRSVVGGLAARRGDTVTARGIEAWLDSQQRPYQHGYNLYLEACIEAELKHPARAVALLRAARRQSSYLLSMHINPCFDPIRSDSAFAALVRSAG
ncbi:MAG TPA: BTAD domain-containing putative transcriptional regulator [Gemmatimonadales bacterium]|nr:BTAD domain-containing putative transcriptional regulator [Gemmatimonadales bacterium]